MSLCWWFCFLTDKVNAVWRDFFAAVSVDFLGFCSRFYSSTLFVRDSTRELLFS